MSDQEEHHIAPDSDEGIADVWEAESTQSVRSSILNYPVEHGRQYHAYKAGSYHRPNDGDEAMRLDIMTALFNLVYDGKMHFAPLAGTAGDRILDIGAGTGTWCIDMGDTYPTAEIIGVDISANMPIMVPPNVRFEVDDVEDSWTYSQPFNFIHSRYMAGSIVDWENLMRQCFENLKPGGWAEFQDFDVDYYSQDGTLSTEHALRRWLTTGHGAASTTGRTLKPGARLEEWMRAAGFVNVQAIKTPLPLGPWPKDKRQKRIGLLNWAQLWEGLEGMSLRLFIEVLGYTEAELQLLLVEVRKNLQDPSIHPIFDLYTVWGQKPSLAT